MKQQDKVLRDALVKNNVCSAEEIDDAIKHIQTSGQSLRDYLLEQEKVTEKQILISLSQHLGMDTIDITEDIIQPDVIARVPVKFVWYYKFMPISVDNNVLTIASATPLDIKIQDEIRMHVGMRIKVVLTEERHLVEILKKSYGLASETIDRIMTEEARREQKEKRDVLDQADWIEDVERKTDDPTISNLVNQIILEAYQKRATDIHIEPYRNKVRFRYRIDGALVDANLPEDVKHFLPQILSRIKILANLSITEKRLPQDGSAVVRTNEQQLDLRISTLPTPRGESIVIRILPTKVMFLSLENLGFNTEGVAELRELVKKPHGIIFMTGPTGSGKTTSLYACLNEINSPARKIITIEDPVEYEMEGITQVQVSAKVNFSFSIGLRSLLRHDPDIIMVGEVRDLETAEIAIRTALTGHLVFSTIHTNDAASGVTRIVDMGVEPYLVASSVEAFVAQRLVRVICPKCKEENKNVPHLVKEEMVQSLGLKDAGSAKIYKGKGCDYCSQTGYYGRKAIFEILKINDAIRSAILKKQRSDYIKKIAIKEGLVTLRQNGWRAVLDGITTPDEIMNLTVKDDAFEDHHEEDKEPKPKGRFASSTVAKLRDTHAVEVKNKEAWTTKEEFESRTHPRTNSPVYLKYQLLKKDPNNPSFLISDGIEYSTVTEDISAGGLRFISRGLFPIGSILELRIQMGEGSKSLSCLGKVCRLEKDSLDNIYTIVNYYLDMSSGDRSKIDKFVKKSSKESDRVEIQQETL